MHEKDNIKTQKEVKNDHEHKNTKEKPCRMIMIIG